MNRPLVKICGVCRPEDAVAAVEAGADFVGMVFSQESKRRVDEADAALIVEAVRGASDEVRSVGVFVDEDPGRINEIADKVGLDMIQFHGSETRESIEKVNRPSINAVRVGRALPELDPDLEVDWILYDTLVQGQEGGTGRTFDWTLLVAHASRHRFFLSGGINLDNVRRAIETVHPDAIDVSSGVEDAPGVKNHSKIEALIRQVKR